MSLERPMKRLTQEEWRDLLGRLSAIYASMILRKTISLTIG